MVCVCLSFLPPKKVIALLQGVCYIVALKFVAYLLCPLNYQFVSQLSLFCI